MEFKPVIFAGVAFLICAIFIVIGVAWYLNADKEEEFYQDEVDKYEDPEKPDHIHLVVAEEEGKEFEPYVNATQSLEDAKESKSTSTIFFIIGIVFFVVALAFLVVHFVIEKKADSKMADTFFMEGGPPADKK